MNDSNKKEFATLFYTTGELYDKSVSKELLQMYFGILKEFSIDQIKSGLTKHALDPKHGTFFPKPADIVRNIDGQQRSATDRALVAWMEVEVAIAAVGSYGTLRLKDKQALMAVKSMGSWQHLCATDRSKLAFKRQEFIANYNAIEKTPLDCLPESLPGIAELENQRNSGQGGAIELLKKLEERKLKQIKG